MNQQKRFILAFALSMLVVLFYLIMNPPKKPETEIKPNGKDTPIITESDTKTSPIKDPSPVSETPGDTSALLLMTETEENTVTVSTDLYEVTFTNKGGTIKSFKLVKFLQECDKEDKSMIDLVPNDLTDEDGNPIDITDNPDNGLPFLFYADGLDELKQTIYSLSKNDMVDGKRVIEFKGVTSTNLEVTKRFTLSNDTYSINLDIEIRNLGETETVLKDLRVNWGPGIIKTNLTKLDRRYYGPTFKVDDKKKAKRMKKKEGEKKIEGAVDWILTSSKYFTVAIIERPDTKVKADGIYYFILKNDKLNIGLYYDSLKLAPSESKTIKLKSYLGPKQKAEVQKFDEDLTEITSFKVIAGLGFISDFLLVLMKFLYRFIPNYGVVIIIITLLFKLVFYPLTHKSMKSMKKMQDIQPILQDLQKRYKDDPKQLQQETMRMYKTYGVNPFSGCLPLLIQTPIFIALYTTFGGAIELRCAPFLFWIQDLSRPDTVAMISNFSVNILPILMGVAMLGQQLVQGSQKNQSQQTAFLKFLPLMFLFFFWNFPSGLVLYWLMNNIFTIIQTMIINKTSESSKKHELVAK